MSGKLQLLLRTALVLLPSVLAQSAPATETHESSSTPTDAVLTYEFWKPDLSVSAFVNNIEDNVVISNATPRF